MNLLFLLFLLTYSIQQNINTANLPFGINNISKLYLGRPSSDFPKAAFIMKLLYGRSDVPFTFKDLYDNYWKIGVGGVPGVLIIDKNFTRAGVFTDDHKFIMPVEGGNISLISNFDIPSYFTKGYAIKINGPPIAESYPDILIAQINDSSFCRICESKIWLDKSRYRYEENLWWYITIQSRDSHFIIYFIGYIQSFNPNNNEGKLKIVLISSQYPGSDILSKLVDYDKLSLLTFIDYDSFLTFEVNSTIDINGYDSRLYVKGDWHF